MDNFIEKFEPSNGTVISISKTYSEKMVFEKQIAGSKIKAIGSYSCYNGQASIVDLHDTEIEQICSFAFAYCPLIELLLPETINRLQSNSLLQVAIPYIYIPTSLETIDSYAFNSAYCINWFEVSSENPKYSSVNGFLMNKKQTIIYQAPRNVTNEDDFPPHEQLDIYALTTSKLVRYIAKSSLRSLYYGAFCATRCLQILDLSKSSVTSLPADIITYSSVSIFILPNGIQSLSTNTFEHKLQIHRLIIPADLISIEKEAFNCSGSMTIVYFGTNDFSNQDIFRTDLAVKIYVTPYYVYDQFGKIPVFRRWINEPITHKNKLFVKSNAFLFTSIFLILGL